MRSLFRCESVTTSFETHRISFQIFFILLQLSVEIPFISTRFTSNSSRIIITTLGDHETARDEASFPHFSKGKTAGADKKLFKTLDHQYTAEILSKSPDLYDISATSPFGPLQDSSSRRTFIYLISLLNAAFPDYDFSNVKPEQFVKEPNLQVVQSATNTNLTGGETILAKETRVSTSFLLVLPLCLLRIGI